MKLPNNNQLNFSKQKDFWDSLQIDMLTSNQEMSSYDYLAFIERSFMFSIFFRGCPPLEVAGFQNILGIKESGYVILIELLDKNKSATSDIAIDTFTLHYYLKDQLKQKNCTVGPLITNRISILISSDSDSFEQNHRESSIALCQELARALETNFHISVMINIGSIQSINSIYTSFIDALSCFFYSSPDQIIYYLDIKHKDDIQFDYQLTEKHLVEAIRLRKAESYDYFGLIMDWLRPLSDDTKRNKILEILVLANHAMRLDSQSEIKIMNYMGYLNEFTELSGNQLIEFAFQSFIRITSYVKPQNSIDYTNHIVRATREYLELHYADDISLENMAVQVNISPQYFSKLIKKTTGFNFIDWLSMLRVKKAKELLTNSNLTVKEVCFMVGYKDPNYFSRIFKKRIGITPSEYIKTSSYLNNKS
ncbi:MAG: helix-turn-helix domain-containing protein [Mobilitalea sp.]